MFIADYHMHTDFSSDSSTSMEDMVKQAIKLGLKEIALTDHVDYDYPDEKFPFIIDYNKYQKVFSELQQKYQNNISLILGVEVGLQPHLVDKIRDFCNSVKFDFIIASSHVVDRLDLYNGDFFKGKEKQKAYTRYFEGVYENIKLHNNFNVYGHLDYVNRYGDYTDKTLNYIDYKDLIDNILKLLISKGKGIEINTSGYRYKLNCTHPQLPILKRYKQLGGEIITVGSDAHDTNNIALHFEDAYKLLEEAGFKYITLFKNQKPQFVKYKS